MINRDFDPIVFKDRRKEKNPEEAWEEVVEGFNHDCGTYPEDYKFEEEDE